MKEIELQEMSNDRPIYNPENPESESNLHSPLL